MGFPFKKRPVEISHYLFQQERKKRDKVIDIFNTKLDSLFLSKVKLVGMRSLRNGKESAEEYIKHIKNLEKQYIKRQADWDVLIENSNSNGFPW